MNFQKLNLASMVGTIIFKGRPLQGEHQDVTSQGDNGKANREYSSGSKAVLSGITNPNSAFIIREKQHTQSKPSMGLLRTSFSSGSIPPVSLFFRKVLIVICGAGTHGRL